VVGAPDELIPTIEEVVKAVDAPVEDVTEVRVFRLRFADPVEMAELLTNLFPDETRSDDSRSPVRFGGGPQGMGRGNNASTGNAASDRMKKQGRVIAVPDQRTSSVVVSAARELMDQIGQMVSQLDENPAKRQKVFVYSLENADVQSVEEILQGLFESQNSRNTRSTTSQGANPLNTRSTANQNSGTSLGNSFGSQNQGGQTLR
jgi:type II secretory pathway component GspD/PulD (secretin)